MMTHNFALFWAFIAGSGLGILFFGGLWYTVKKALGSDRPALWLLASFLSRTGITLAGFYYLASGDWRNLLAGLFGFIVARYLVVQFTQTKQTKQPGLKKEA